MALNSDSDWTRSVRIYEQYINNRNLNHIVIVESIALAGVFIMFTGYKYLRFAMFAAGFWLAFCVFYVFSPIFLRKQYCCDKEKFHSVHIGSSVAVGIIAGLFTSSLYRFGVLLLGKCLGILLAIVVIHCAVNVHDSSKLLLSILVAVMAFVVASLTWKFEKIVLIISTSSLGSFMALCGIDIFVRSNFSLIIFSLLLYIRDAFMTSLMNKAKIESANLPKLHKVDKTNSLSTIFISAWMFLSIFSTLIQIYVTSKNIEKGGEICPFSSTTLCKCLFPCCYQCKLANISEKSNTK